MVPMPHPGMGGAFMPVSEELMEKIRQGENGKKEKVEPLPSGGYV